MVFQSFTPLFIRQYVCHASHPVQAVTHSHIFSGIAHSLMNSSFIAKHLPLLDGYCGSSPPILQKTLMQMVVAQTVSLH